MSASPDIVVRRATLDDAAGVAAVLNAVIAGGRHSLLDTPFTVAAERDFMAALPARAFLHVAEAPGAGVVGFQTVEPWSRFATTAFEHVATMGTYVAEGSRRRGIGRRLAEASFAAARELGYTKICTDVRADNLDSLAFHIALGFAVVGTARRHARLGGREVDVITIEHFL